jgi:two-component system, cell cycle sensor histidine kinase and response regulator CckA
MPYTILLVEDELSIRMLIRAALVSAGYNVFVASNGEEGVRLFDEHGSRIDLLITDMRMPRLGGLDLIDTLRQRRKTLKVLCITGYPVPGAEHLEDTILYKPFTREELLKAVKKQLTPM